VILEATLDLVISLVTCVVERADGISVSLHAGDAGEFHTPTATSVEVREIDAAQYESGRGPCVDAARVGQAVSTVIASEHGRWPEFSREAARRGVKSVLSMPLFDGEHVIGALNVYSKHSEAFSDGDRRLVAHFADHAGVVLRRASEFMTRGWICQQVTEAMSRADVVGQAKGILIGKGYSGAEAMASLRRAAARRNRRLSEVAQEIVASSRRGRPT
jgi:transcriptional regulator with GAF, ATPase, and Fis domain